MIEEDVMDKDGFYIILADIQPCFIGARVYSQEIQ